MKSELSNYPSPTPPHQGGRVRSPTPHSRSGDGAVGVTMIKKEEGELG